MTKIARAAASVSPSRVHPAPSGVMAPHLGENAAARQPLRTISPVKVGELSSQLREGRPTGADPGHFA